MSETKFGPGKVYGSQDSIEVDEAEFGEWRPIETAPLNVEEGILGWGPNGFEIAFWSDGEWVDVEYGLIHPTHWMPLPEPPK